MRVVKGLQQGVHLVAYPGRRGPAQPGGGLAPGRRNRLAVDDEVFEDQGVDARAREAEQRILRSAHDGLTAHVERGVEQDWAAGAVGETRQEGGKARARLRIDRLQT